MRLAAAKRRKNAAHGASRGCRGEERESPQRRKKSLRRPTTSTSVILSEAATKAKRSRGAAEGPRARRPPARSEKGVLRPNPAGMREPALPKSHPFPHLVFSFPIDEDEKALISPRSRTLVKIPSLAIILFAAAAHAQTTAPATPLASARVPAPVPTISRTIKAMHY